MKNLADYKNYESQKYTENCKMQKGLNRSVEKLF